MARLQSSAHEQKRDYSREYSRGFRGQSAVDGGMLDAMTRSMQMSAEAMSAVNSELMRFVSARMEEDSQLGKSLSECSSWTEAAKAHQQWAMNAMQDYFQEAFQILRLSFEIAGERLGSIEEEVKQRQEAMREEGEEGMHYMEEEERKMQSSMRGAGASAASAAGRSSQQAKQEAGKQEPGRPKQH